MEYTTKETFSAIVAYTISEKRKALRDTLRDKLISSFEEKPLDESTYGIGDGNDIDALIAEVAKMCKESEKESNTTFDQEDSVLFFRVDNNTIRKHTIVPTIIELENQESINSIENLLETGREQVTDTWRKAANKL